MKRAKSLIAFMFFVLLWLSVASVEYDLLISFGPLFSVLVSVFVSLLLLDALLRAPEGYEDEKGFHIGALTGATLP
jgi:hypothetical protein